jgi:hypothetical protein
MFEGRKTSLFWTGAVILGVSLGYFCLFIYNGATSAILYPNPLEEYLTFAFPFLTGAITFMMISLFMMQKGAKEELLRKYARRYWIGLITLGIGSIYLLITFWIGLVYYRLFTIEYWSNQLPSVAVPIVFVAFGLYGMKTGIKRMSL